MKIIDIGANLLDDMFKGIYNGRTCHPPDMDAVLTRAQSSHVGTVIVTAGSMEDIDAAHNLISSIRSSPVGLFTTAGIHPTRACTVTSDAVYCRLQQAAESPLVKAVGECGLDYARLDFSPRPDQIAVFCRHFAIAAATRKPMFLHLREAFDDFYEIVKKHREEFGAGVVHSFDGTVDEAMLLVNELDLYIGINGCSVRKDEGLSVIKTVPLDRLMVESDAPWCEIRPSHSSYQQLAACRYSFSPKRDKDKWDRSHWVKGRNEPAVCLDICQLIAYLKNVPLQTVTETIHATTKHFFNL